VLNAMRKYAKEVLLVTVILFVFSLFGIGAYSFFSKGKNKKETKQVSSIATINNKAVDEARFYRQFNQVFASIPQEKRIILDPDIIDYYRYDAFQKTVSFMLMKEEAEKQGIKALPQEVNYRIDQIVKMYGMKSKNELKKILKEKKMPYSEFKAQQKEEILVAKAVNGIAGRATVTPLDKKMAFIEIKTRHILIKIPSSNDVEKAEIEALKKAQNITEMVLANKAKFAELAKIYSEDKLTAEKGGDLGWVSRGQMVPEFEKQLYKLLPGDVGGPVKSMYGYHIILVEDRKTKPVPQGVSEQDIDNQILQEKQSEAVRKWMKPIQDASKIEIFDPALKAYEYRVANNYEKAIVEYQRVLSGQPQNLIIYIQIARMYEKLDRLSEAQGIYEKAMIWQKYNPQYQYPILYIANADYLIKNGQKPKASELINSAIKLFGTNQVVLQYIADNYKTLLAKAEYAGLETKIDEIKKKAEEEKRKKALVTGNIGTGGK